MTTQPETPVVERVSRIEGIVEQVNLRLAENHDDIQALSAKIDAQGEALRAEIREGDAALSEKIDAQGRELNAKIDAQNEKIDRLRSEMHRQTVLVVGLLGGLMALLRFVG